MKKLLASKKGFTLVELIVVIVIIVILAAALVTSLVGYINKAKETNALLEAQSVYTASQALISEYVGLHGFSDGDYTFTPESPNYNVTFDDLTDGINKYVGSTIIGENAGTITKLTVNGQGTIIAFEYTASNGLQVTYSTDNNWDFVA